jgi:hypothetical protein
MKRNARVLGVFFVAMMTVLAAVGVSRAQNTAARIVGNVTDPNGGAVPTARISVTNSATQVHYDTTANRDGYFQAVDLPIGSYNVTIQASGFRTVTYSNQALQINQVLRLDAKLEIGSLTESIEVKDQVEVVETVNPTLGASVTGRTLTDMPLNGRNVMNLALLQPGVTPTNPDDKSAGMFNIAGGRADSVTFLIDGGLNNNLLSNGMVVNPNPDTVAEFRILKSDYTAEYGRNGGGIISEVLKSGTNEWHGSAFDFIRNGAFNANRFFNKNDVNNLLPRDALRRHQFGGTFGGPITIPKVVHGKDRFFFFVGYQGQRESSQQSVTGLPVFTSAQITGDFSGANSDPKNGVCKNADKSVAAFLQANPFFQSDPTLRGCAVIDPNQINGVAKKYIAAGLIPAAPTGTLNFQGATVKNNNELTMKFDFNMTQKDRLAVTLHGIRFPTSNGVGNSGFNAVTALPGYPLGGYDNSYFANLAYTRTVSTNLVNEFRATVQRDNLIQDVPGRTLSTPKALGAGVTPDVATGPTAILFNDQSTYAGFSIQGPSKLINNTFIYTDSVSWTRGRHNWKFGGGFSAYQFNTVFDFIVDGVFDFVGTGGSGSQNDFADFLFGIPTAFFQSPAAATNARSKFSYGFAQDEWRVSKKLVLTLGVRYEYGQPKYDTHGVTFNVIPGLHSTVFPHAPAGLVFPGDKGAPRGVNFPDKANWAPRLGFAWDPAGNAKTSIRGGFGIFYDILKAEDNFQDNGQPPFFSGANLFYNPISVNPTQDVPYMSQPYTTAGNAIPANTFPSKPVDHNVDFAAAGFLPYGGTSIFLDDPHLRTPRTYQYNLSVQREIAKNTALEISYVGSTSRGLTALIDSNPFVLGTTDRVLNLLPGNSTCTASSGQCSFTNLPTFKNVSRASYNGLQAGLTKQVSDSRFIGRTYFTLGYTYAHSIDNASGFRNRNTSVPSYQRNLFRASSDFDVRHRITFSAGWDLPFDRMLSRAPKRLTQGWSLYPIVSWRTGFPLDILGQPDSSGGFTNPGVTGAGDLAPHANLTGQPITTFDPHQSQTLTGDLSGSNTGNFYFNPNAFTSAQVLLGSDPCLAPSPTCFPSTAQVVANPSLLTYGTLPRNFLRGPGQTNIDMSFAKSTSISERLKLEIRGDFFNLFNHTEFNNPVTTIGSSKFGQVTDTADPRIIQLAVRFTF